MPYKDKEKGKEYKKQYYIKHREESLGRMLKYRENNRGKLNEASKLYRLNNLKKVRETSRRYYQKNKERLIEKSKQWGINNPEERKVIVLRWKKNNPEKINKTKRVWTRMMYKTNIAYKLKEKISGMMRQLLKGGKNDHNFIISMGYTVETLKKHLKKTMPKGYCWQDYLEGRLHIDHIIPKRVFEFKTPKDKEFKQCWSLYNLRLLPAEENTAKQDKIDNPFLLGLLIKEGDLNG